MQWTTKALPLGAMVGTSGVSPDSPEWQTWVDERGWTRHEEKFCNLAARLYCFEN